MAEIRQLDRTHYFIMRTFVERGFAPHYTEIAKEFAVSPDEGKKLLRELMNFGLGATWLHPNTDHIVAFAPFSNLPTQYRITVDSQQKWYAPGGFDALAVCWAFPGKSVQIDAPCLDCNEHIHVVLRDGVIENLEPAEICGYTSVPISQWMDNWPSTGSSINLFRSEEHVRNWSGFKGGTDQAILSLANIIAIFSTPRHTAKMSEDYVSSYAKYGQLFFKKLKEVTCNSSFWAPSSRGNCLLDWIVKGHESDVIILKLNKEGHSYRTCLVSDGPRVWGHPLKDLNIDI